MWLFESGKTEEAWLFECFKTEIVWLSECVKLKECVKKIKKNMVILKTRYLLYTEPEF